MKTSEASGDAIVAATPPDAELIALFHSDPQRAWEVFIDRYSDVIFAFLQRQGFDYDRAMDRFVYICEKLSEQDFRRLKSVRYAGNSGELTPWLLQVVRNLSINWAWSEEGRKRLLKPITRLPLREQRIFELYFWKGLTPSAIREQLHLETNTDTDLVSVLDSLERIFSLLSRKKLWRLMGNLARARGEVSIDEVDEETGFAVQLLDYRTDPEMALLEREAEARMNRAMECLTARQRLAVEFRYEEGLSLKDTARVLHATEKEIKILLRDALKELKRAVK
ncbi:MAG TPA: sigma factor-like helix-turn-helix DNA-binding protein [Blastocatellia bacterium]|nr:sigma factor-like helix-turn-helix DNA-binding protein [Blastocatellia bacterium]